MMNENLSIIIPTLGRTDCLRRLLASVERQEALPGELIIVDGGPDDISDSLKDFADMNIRYLNTKVPSLTKQRNTGIRSIKEKTELVGFVDDDIVFEENSLKSMLDFWRTADAEVGGAAFNNITSCFIKGNIIDRIFCIKGSRGGRLLRSGFNTQLSQIDGTRRVDWLFGGITIWRRRVVEEFKFDEWFKGNAFCDDIDYSYRVSKKYKMMAVKEARVSHLGQPHDSGKEYLLGRTVTQNRLYFVSKHKELSVPLCYWAHIGLCLENLFFGMTTLRKNYFSKAAGIISGLIKRNPTEQDLDAARSGTIKRYSFLWSRYPVQPPEKFHFDSMQKVIPEGIVSKGVGLDLGCGRGHDTFFMAKGNPETRIIGLDISEGVYAASRLNSGMKNVAIIRGSASGIPLKNGACDFIYSYGVLHHMRDYKKGLHEIHRVLKQGCPVFLYLYEDHSGNPIKLLGIKAVSLARKATVKMPPRILFFLVSLMSPLTVMLFSWPARFFKGYKVTYRLYEKWPFNFGTSLLSVRGDLYDRFSAPVEKRFNERALRALFDECNFNGVKTARLDAAAGWVVWAHK